jgi:plastocyanin
MQGAAIIAFPLLHHRVPTGSDEPTHQLSRWLIFGAPTIMQKELFMPDSPALPEVAPRTLATTITNRRRLLQLAIAAGAGSALLGGNRAVFAQATPVEGTPAAPALPPGCTLYADGLANPRYLAIADDGTIYVTEAGAAGDEIIYQATPEAGTPAPTEQVGARGETGQVTAIAPDGSKTVIAGGLPSYLFGAEVVGPAGIALVDGKLFVAVGGAGPMTPMVEPLANEDSVLSIDPATGEVTNIANIGLYERSDNPDPNAVDSNLYDLISANGTIYVTDAGGNAIYKVDPATNDFSVFAVIPGLPGPGANPNRQGASEIDPVPTSLAMMDDGTLLVGLLSGFPFTPGAAGILKVAPDGTVSNWAGGLTMVTDVAIAPDGSIYATQISTNFLGEPPAPGNIVRVRVDGASEVVLDGLSAPNGMAFDANGDLYFIMNTFGPGSGGMIVKCTDPASLTGGGATPDAAAGASGTVVSTELKFTPKEFDVPAGTDYTLTVHNDGVLPHDFTCDALKLNSGLLQTGEEKVLTFNAPAGDYQFYCSVIGHKQAGMIGTIHVK